MCLHPLLQLKSWTILLVLTFPLSFCFFSIFFVSVSFSSFPSFAVFSETFQFFLVRGNVCIHVSSGPLFFLTGVNNDLINALCPGCIISPIFNPIQFHVLCIISKQSKFKLLHIRDILSISPLERRTAQPQPLHLL